MNYPVPRCDAPGCHGHLSKFDDCVSEAVWEWSMDMSYVDRDTGSCDFAGHYALVIVPQDDTHTLDEGSPDAYVVAVPAGHYVVFTASGGGVSVTHYATPEEAAQVMDSADSAYADWLGDDD